MERIVLHDGAWCVLHRRFLESTIAERLFSLLLDEVAWERRAIMLYGRSVLQPRLTAWVGDSEAAYTYSRTRHEPLAWTPTLQILRDQISECAGVAFNGVLCNLYRDGQDSMGLHSDSEPELGPDPVVASLSLGATRKFCLRHHPGSKRAPRKDRDLDLDLPSGSLLIMQGATQHCYRHSLPKQTRVKEPRINLTFRRILSSA